MQMPARTPAMTAMTAATLDLMSGGRFLLGLGASGPQVVEGWHGAAVRQAARRRRASTSRSCARSCAREAPLEHHGAHYDIPYTGPDATGLGKPLKIIVHPRRADIPIYLAAIGPKNVQLCRRDRRRLAADLLLARPRSQAAYGAALDAGLRTRRRRQEPRPSFDIAPTVTVIVGDDVDALREHREADDRALRRRHGRAGQELLQRPRVPLRLRGRGEGDPGPLPRRQEARGDRPRCPTSSSTRSRSSGRRSASPTGSSAWQESGITTMILGAHQPEALRLMAELVL